MKKYELTGQTKVIIPSVIVLHRIRALRGIQQHGVKVGDLGGWIESEKNLSQEGECWVGGNALVYGGSFVAGDALVDGDAVVKDISIVAEDALVEGCAIVAGYSIVKGDAIVRGDTRLSSNAIIASTHDYLVIGPIGSRDDYTTFYCAATGIWVCCGCFNGEIEKFKNEVKRTHGDNKYAKEYMDAIEFAYKRFQTT